MKAATRWILDWQWRVGWHCGGFWWERKDELEVGNDAGAGREAEGFCGGSIDFWIAGERRGCGQV